ncbi:MAG: ATP-binding cassette domain-containing protein [Paracoccus sp. (in: a-proteobacteria)]|uniref:oligopeptide/dipeptide ABC transporter ATP-binding protein n=1 Tax=Paracoccus sp. TaxID=267 RepID=UPI0026E033EE|nr:oligopeptide/dipeptide ABC transporter ATP-binding protein [Paracoccus sp. (in: a-proteobacteria)]MDO5631371.1 ATP-binding cassette domain-containing protein [Paracoccus sp. (in: a-proteobacteria)]
MALLDIKDLNVSFATNDGTVHAVNGVDLTMQAGDTLGIVGESGSGKSQLAFSIMGLLARNGRATGSVKFDGQEILNAPPKVLNKIRAEQIAMIFQDPMTSLNPYMRVADQMAEVLVLHNGMSKTDAVAESARMLDAVKIPDAKGRIRLYPHEFSGGMRQRVMIAMALLCKPRLLIADEPTTALDVTVQAQIMALLADLQRDLGMAMILITHDLGVVAGSCRDVVVMYGGRIRETGPVLPLFDAPAHPYTQGLLEAIPRVDQKGDRLSAIPGSPPNMSRPPKGCAFEPRCTYRMDRCATKGPELLEFAPDRRRACFADLEDVIAHRDRVHLSGDPMPQGDAPIPEAIPLGAVAGAGMAGTPTEGGRND